MAPFSFPDPAVQTTVIHPDTGEYWIFEDGVWMISDDDPCAADVTPAPTPTSTPSGDDAGDGITSLKIEIAALKVDIINLRAQLSAATVNNFLILE